MIWVRVGVEVGIRVGLRAEALAKGYQPPRIDHTVPIILPWVASTSDIVLIELHRAIRGVGCALDRIGADVIMAAPADLKALLPSMV